MSDVAARTLQVVKIGLEFGVEVQPYSFTSGDSQEIANALDNIKAAGHNIIIIAVFSEDIKDLLFAADDRGMVGQGFVYISPPNGTRPPLRGIWSAPCPAGGSPATPGARTRVLARGRGGRVGVGTCGLTAAHPLAGFHDDVVPTLPAAEAARFAQLLQGNLVVYTDPVASDSAYFDSLSEELRLMSPEDFPEGLEAGLTREDLATALSGQLDVSYAAFVYDAVWTAALGLARLPPALRDAANNVTRGSRIVEEIVGLEFDGSSGTVRFNHNGDRDASTVWYTLEYWNSTLKQSRRVRAHEGVWMGTNMGPIWGPIHAGV